MSSHPFPWSRTLRVFCWSICCALAISSLPAQTAGAPAEVEGDESASLDRVDPNSPEMAWWRESMKTREQRLDWWRDARFGMFVHWGIYSAMAGEWKGTKLTSGYTEHIQRRLKIPNAVYQTEVARTFNPVQFNAEEWVLLAKEAGMGYFIITAKHHDGFAMYDSAVSDFTIVKSTPFKRDPMKELRDACRKHGIKFGFYYSHAFDWGEENGPGNDWDYDNPGGDKLIGGADWWKTRPEFLPKARRYVNEKSIPQLQELIRNYQPDAFWFDTPHKLPPSENVRIMKAVREASPNVIINGRLVRGMGDYDSTADKPAEFFYRSREWEGVPTTNESYGWSPWDQSHKPASHFIGLLIKATGRGGNNLMNVGPMGNGQIDPKDVEILKGIGRWWAVNGESIRGAGATPLPVQSWGESTAEGNTLYLHVLDWPTNGRLLVGGLRTKIKRAYLLADPAKKALPVQSVNTLDWSIGIPRQAPDAVASVVAVECEQAPATDIHRLLQPSAKPETLRVFDGQLQGSVFKFGQGKATNAYIENWTSPAEKITWPLRSLEAGAYDVSVRYDAEQAGNSFDVILGEQRLTGVVEKGVEVIRSLGRITVPSSTFTLTVQPKEIKSGELMRLRGLILTPVASVAKH
jgi:alpha-L-fucosidase